MGIKSTNNCLKCLTFDNYRCTRMTCGDSSTSGGHICDFFVPADGKDVFGEMPGNMSLKDMGFRETKNCFNCNKLQLLFLSHECLHTGISDMLSEGDVCEAYEYVS